MAAALVSSPAHAIEVGIDDFLVLRNGATFFDDTFADGLVPPSGPNGGATYNVSGTIPSTAESGGLLLLDSANGDVSANAQGDPRLSVRVRLQSNIDPSNQAAGLGLKSNDTLAVSGIFTLSAPPGPDNAEYSVRFNDSSGGGAHQIVQLQVRFNPTTGAPEIRYIQQDFDAGTITTLGSAPFAPPSGADRIRLTINRPSVLNNDFLGSFSYLAGGSVLEGGSFATAGQMFEGENFVRAEFNVSQAIPEPGTLALLLAGLAGIGTTRIRRRR
jgi:hypothetical protein